MSMMSMDIIHVHAKKGGEHGEVKGNSALETNDCLWTMHEISCCVKPPLHKIHNYKKD